MKRVVLLENDKYVDKLKKDDLIIAFYPDIYVTLLKKGFNVISIDKFFNPNDHFEVSKKSDKLTQKLLFQLKQKNIFKTKTALNDFEFYTKVLFSYVYMLDLVLKKVQKEYKNIKIFYQKNIKVDLNTLPLISSNEEILGFFIDKINIQYKKPNKIVSKIINFISNKQLEKYENIIFTSFQNGNLRKYLKTLPYTPIQIRISDKNQFKELVFSLRNYFKNEKIVTFTSDTKLFDIKFELQEDEKRIFNIVKHKVDILFAYLYKLENTPLPKGDFKILSISNLGMLSILAEKSNNDSYLLAHGTFVLPKENQAKIEQIYSAKGQLLSDTFKYKLIQSPYALDFFESKKNLIETFPIAWGEKFEKTANKNKKIVVLHAATPKLLLRPIIFETQFEYVNSIIEIAKVLENENVEFLVRFRPMINISISTMEYLLKDFKNTKIVTDKSFNYWLDKSDVLISYSSTTIEEAILNEKRVIQYSKIYRHIPDIPWSNNINELKKMILNYDKLEYKFKSFKDKEKFKI